MDEDQADRMPQLASIDWKTVGPREDSRLKRVKEIYSADNFERGTIL